MDLQTDFQTDIQADIQGVDTPLNIQALYQRLGGYLEGHFLLASGRHSPVFLQSTTVLQHPLEAQRLGAALALRLRDLKPGFVIGPAMGGVVLAFVVARALGCRALFAEKMPGGMSVRDAFQIESGEAFVAVEDVLTTGGSLRQAIRAAEERGARCIGTACLIDRGLATLEGALTPRALARLEFPTYPPEDCPLCRDGLPLEHV